MHYVEWSLFFITVLLIAAEDIKQHRISNQYLLFLAVLKFFSYLKEFLLHNPNLITTIGDQVSGAIIGFFVFFVFYILAKGNLGAGDVKLCAVFGLYVGGHAILGVMTVGLMLAGMTGILLLLLKKIGRKDPLPLAPFFGISAALSVIFSGMSFL